MAQRFYAARTPAECQKIGMLWTLLFAFRWPMAIGIVIIGIRLGVGGEDPEKLLPQVLTSDIFPAGIRGIVVAALFAASMSTFDSTINAGASYVVRDLFLPLKHKASEKAQVLCGYIASTAIVAIGLVLAMLAVESVVDIWITIVIQLFPAFLVPFALRWFWGRFNGEGFSLGIIFGFAASILVATTSLGSNLNEAQTLGAVSAVSLLGCIIGTFVFKPTPTQTLYSFFQQIRPNGLWRKDWKIPHKAELGKNWIRLAVAIVWQIATFMLPMFLVLNRWSDAAFLAIMWTASFVLLSKLSEDESESDALQTE